MLAPTMMGVLIRRCRRGGHWPSARENLQRCETERECKSDNFQCHRSGHRNNDACHSQRELAVRRAPDERCSPLRVKDLRRKCH